MKKRVVFSLLLPGLLAALSAGTGAQSDDESQFRVVVDLVQLNIAVTDKNGNYVTGLRPSDFVIKEDDIPQKVATFAEGNEPTRRVSDLPPANAASTPVGGGVPGVSSILTPGTPETLGTAIAGANVYILFDTSNYMYRGFVYAQDAISDFVRSLETPDKIAFYSYSRNLSRAAPLTADRSSVVRGVRTTVAGDDAAFYNSLLMTVKDASRIVGRKVVVVFSNGPDNASTVPPEDVAELAQSSGIPIYMISTREARLEPVSTAVFERMTAATGGKAYFSKNWRDEKKAFASIRDDLGHLYSLSYYPKPNPNRGWRSIEVKLVGEKLKGFRIRTRNGYRPLPNRFSAAGEPTARLSAMPE